jgi:hypothetical protein
LVTLLPPPYPRHDPKGNEPASQGTRGLEAWCPPNFPLQQTWRASGSHGQQGSQARQAAELRVRLGRWSLTVVCHSSRWVEVPGGCKRSRRRSPGQAEWTPGGQWSQERRRALDPLTRRGHATPAAVVGVGYPGCRHPTRGMIRKATYRYPRDTGLGSVVPAELSATADLARVRVSRAARFPGAPGC